jgi:hypothetical protein
MAQRRDFWERAEARFIPTRAEAGLALPEDGGTPWTDDEQRDAEIRETESSFTEDR